MANLTKTEPTLSELARQAGLVRVWQDVHGRTHQVSDDTLRALLDALGLPCRSYAQIRTSLGHLESTRLHDDGAMILADANKPIVLACRGSTRYRLIFENGEEHTGCAQRVSAELVSLAPIASIGYHSLTISGAQRCVAVAPARCPSVGDLTGNPTGRIWGVAAQLYSLRQQTGAVGAGDYSALAQLARQAADQGASAVAVSPVHAMFSSDPQRYSPYSPSSRIFLNVAYIDPVAVLGKNAVYDAMKGLDASHAATAGVDVTGGNNELIDWARLVPARLRLFRRLFQNFEQQADYRLQNEFQRFRRAGAQALEHHGRYEALHAWYADSLGAASGWQDWPADLRDPASPAALNFAAQHQDEVSFHIFLQWLADEGLRQAQHSALEACMPIGLITDLAIGTDARGSHVWSRQSDILSHVSAGAAPDLFQPAGQDWGLAVFSPRALRNTGYAAFIETLQAVFKHAGGVRVDHILGLARMWLVPQGAAAADGAYLQYPAADMLRLLALEAWRHRAIVVGENLGTVPPGFNDRLAQRGLYGTSVLWFERHDSATNPGADRCATPADTSAPGQSASSVTDKTDHADAAESTGADHGVPAFTLPSCWSSQSVAMSTTHDLPTIAGWWTGSDLQWRRRLEAMTDAQFLALEQERERDKQALWRALRQGGCTAQNSIDLPAHAPREAVLTFLARTPAPLVVVPVEDLLGLTEQPNLPGASGTVPPCHPNWLRRLPISTEQMFDDAGVRACIAAVTRGRGKR